MKVFRVNYGIIDETGEEINNYSFVTCVANDAKEAIALAETKAKIKNDSPVFIESVEKIVELD
jgi:transposase-like protein